jgi:hypothetical protein
VFTLRIAPANTSAVIIGISGVLQSPNDYAVVGNLLTFSSPPPTGNSHISVRYLSLPASNVVNSAYRSVTDITATAGQTTFSTGSYTPGFVEVFRNGVRLGVSNYTATSGVTVVLGNPANAGDLVTVVSFFVSSVINAIPGTSGAVTANLLDASQQGGAGAMIIPTGSSGQRPTGPVIGMVRNNSSLLRIETYDGTNWVNVRSYIRATGGNRIIEQNGFKYHIFTQSGTFTVTDAVTADVLIVAGGGAGGTGFGDQDTGKGGGGSGGICFRSGFPIAAGAYPLVVGAGGAGFTPTTSAAPPTPNNGANSTAFGITASGGGGGGRSDNAGGPAIGGSGGGGGSRNGTTSLTNGVGSNQGAFAGWTTYGSAGGNGGGNSNFGGGGGGGAGGNGLNAGGVANDSWGGAGGVGVDFSSFFPSTVFWPGSNLGGQDVGFYGGGGGGGTYGTSACRNPALGGLGGGGHGSACRESNNGTIANTTFINGIPNTGGGGGGAAEDGQSAGGFNPTTASRSGSGGSGVIMIRYAI